MSDKKTYKEQSDWWLKNKAGELRWFINYVEIEKESPTGDDLREAARKGLYLRKIEKELQERVTN